MRSKLLHLHFLIVNNKVEMRIDTIDYLVGICETLEQSGWDITDLIKK